MVTEAAPADLSLKALTSDKPRTLQQWLTTFHLVSVVLDPYTAESAWLLPTVGRILRVYEEADCRVAITVTCDEVGARQFLDTLHAVGYQGPLCIEREAGNQRLADVKFAVESLKKAAG